MAAEEEWRGQNYVNLLSGGATDGLVTAGDCIQTPPPPRAAAHVAGFKLRDSLRGGCLA